MIFTWFLLQLYILQLLTAYLLIHSQYPFDYAASEFGISSQFNPSKLFIDMLAAVGLVWGRKRGTAAWDMGRTRRERDRAAGIPLPKPAPRPWETQNTSAVKQD